MMNRRVVLTGVLCCFESAPACAQTASEPRAIVEQIYKISAGKNGKYDSNSAFFQAAVQKRWFSIALIAQLGAVDAYTKKTEDLGIDFDPVTNSQDPSVTRLTITQESGSANEAIVLAKFFAKGAALPDNVRYYFIREGGAWKLNDIGGNRGGKDGWLISNIVKEILKQ